MSNSYSDQYNDAITALNAKMWEADFLPDGWATTFIPELKKELARALGIYVYDFTVFQIKEKNGALRIYWSWAIREYDYNEIYDLDELTEEIDFIINKYEKISAKTCVVCGAEATTTTSGWVMPMCNHCFENGV